MNGARIAWCEVCLAEYRITGDMMKSATFADSVERRIRAEVLREAAIEAEAVCVAEGYEVLGEEIGQRLRRMADETSERGRDHGQAART